MATVSRLLKPDKILRPVLEWKERILRERAHGILLWPGLDRKAATDVVADTQEQLSSVDRSFPRTQVRRLLHKVPLDELQVFWTLAFDHEARWVCLGA